MATDPNPSVAPNSLPQFLAAEITQALAAGLGDFSLRELLGLILTSPQSCRTTRLSSSHSRR